MEATKIDTNELIRYLDSSTKRVYRDSDIAEILRRYRGSWGLPRTFTHAAFARFLLENTSLKEVNLACSAYSAITRYTWGKVSPLLVAVSVKNLSYLSHGSALFVHGLGGSRRDIYINYEQSEKPPSDAALTQDAIDRAFKNEARRSQLIYEALGASITVINGKQTGRLGVTRVAVAKSEELEVTGLERTLIDITVRPVYAGGVAPVLKAFKKAKGRVSTSALARMLQRLDYRYPYHQAVGFYLERAGYAIEDQELFGRLGAEFDFYLCNGTPNPTRDEKWRIFYPKGLR